MSTFVKRLGSSHIFSEITEMLPGILNQLGAESLTHLKKLANNVTSQFKSNEDEDVPGCHLGSLIITISIKLRYVDFKSNLPTEINCLFCLYYLRQSR